ncbi:polysaccharide biosynthesis protein [Listeria booriae]|uniref:Polysaccharide biosynthesis protein n=1 Tax=Listeria booriae TaxID=1552123 RepID=A0A841ZWW6_9LIST|nr:nucleoside-diphosphate sugar epimerase/dehydratase [Listeria booriae]MBC1565096.1 polysaccharide biosynthesis protein [Listeria booriae]
MKKVVILGAGELGMSVLNSLIKDYAREYSIVGFLDDDKTKYQSIYQKCPVLGNLDDLENVIKSFDVQMMVVAIADLGALKREELIRLGFKAGIQVKSIPGIRELMIDNKRYITLEDITMQKLLGRSQIEMDQRQLHSQIKNKIVLVTGAGGSIGSELCKQLLAFNPAKLLLLGHGENSIYNLMLDINSPQVEPIIADIQSRSEMKEVFKNHRPEIIYHAAAHKHVPLMEKSFKRAFKNNFIGTKNVADLAEMFHAKTFVMVSTDKAVKPINNMGRTKRLAEMYIQMMAQNAECNFSVVRFGNVLGSRGSVIPLFQKQIKAGGPITVTDRKMTRYFMTIPEAASLVLQAGALAENGEIYVLEMGEPVKIVDLAQNMIKLSGYSLEEIKIIETGIRSGEKLHEELLDATEIYKEQISEKIHIGRTVPFNSEVLVRLANSYRNMTVEELFEETCKLTNKELLSMLCE